MPRFNYIALDSRGQESSGLVDALTSNDAIGQLRQAGYFPTNVYEEGPDVGAEKKTRRGAKATTAAPTAGKSKGIVLFAKKTVKPKILMVFTRQLATLIDAGLPLLRGLNVLAKQRSATFCSRIRSTKSPIPCRAAAHSPKAWRSTRGSLTSFSLTW